MIACNIMDTKCRQSNNWVNHYNKEAIHKHEQAENGHGMIELTHKQQQEAEEKNSYLLENALMEHS
jgi:hypothetical protein